MKYHSVRNFVSWHNTTNQHEYLAKMTTLKTNVDDHDNQSCAIISADNLTDRFANRMQTKSHVSQHDASDTNARFWRRLSIQQQRISASQQHISVSFDLAENRYPGPPRCADSENMPLWGGILHR